MRHWWSLVVAFVVVQVGGLGAAPVGPAEEIVGRWRGTSACVDRQAAPACTDEKVIYEIVANPARPGAVTVKADKVVDGKRVPMGDLDFSYETTSRTWTSLLDTPRMRAIWRLSVSGATLSGALTLLPSKSVTRRVDLRKDK